jgi:hypothetical protein
LYNRLFDDVATSYEGTASVLERAGVHKAVESSRRVNMDMRTEDGRSVMTMEVSESRLVPLDVTKVGEGVWNFLANNKCGNYNDLFKRVWCCFKPP